MSEPRKPGDEVEPGTDRSTENLCPRCSGTGKAEGRPCPDCDGTGKVTTLIGDA